MSGSADLEPRRLPALLAEAGWNLRGAIPVEHYDARVAPPWRSARLLPEARSALVLGSGGRALWSAFRRSEEFSREVDPLDAFCSRVALRVATLLEGRAVLAHESREGVFADLVALGVEAGLGVRSRLALLVHPVYGPWLSIRAAVLTPRLLEQNGALEDFDPCPDCPAPCAAACHGAAVLPEGFQIERCVATRAREPACGARCDARRACVLGPEHAYAREAEAHHLRGRGAPGPS